MTHPETQKMIDADIDLLSDHLRDFAAEAPHGARIAFAQEDLGRVADNLYEDLICNRDGEWPSEDDLIEVARDYVSDLG